MPTIEECDQHVDGDEGGGEAGEQAEDDQDAADELGERGDVAEPVGKAEGDDVVDEVMQRGVRGDLFVAVHDHGEAERETQEEGAPGLEIVEHLVIRISLRE